MRVFVSSVISGLSAERLAVKQAIESLSHQAVMAEDFPAQPNTPQVACLDGLRQAQAAVLILGAKYGALQSSGLSATHEEYREAKQRLPVFVFIDDRAELSAEQLNFKKEVQAWNGGQYTTNFSSPEELRKAVTKALHHWEIQQQAAPIDPEEMLMRAESAVPRRWSSGFGTSTVALVIVSAPHQEVLRPSDLERPEFAKEIMQEAMFGTWPVLNAHRSSEVDIVDDRLEIDQEESRSIALTADGTIVLRQPASKNREIPGIIEEDFLEILANGLNFAGWLLDRVDETCRLSHFAIVAHLQDGALAWRTRKECQANPNSYTVNIWNEPKPVRLQPPYRRRPVLRQHASDLAVDLLTLIRRQVKAK